MLYLYNFHSLSQEHTDTASVYTCWLNHSKISNGSTSINSICFMSPILCLRYQKQKFNKHNSVLINEKTSASILMLQIGMDDVILCSNTFDSACSWEFEMMHEWALLFTISTVNCANASLLQKKQRASWNEDTSVIIEMPSC